jgi:hypothetical protein
LDKRKPSNKEIDILLKNTFGIQAAVDTIKRAKGDKYNFDFIKYASQII